MSSTPGRPREASKELLQEAAFELFQLHGYRNTSVEKIAKVAGFSRATFFNFFSSKVELFWLETDALVTSLSEFLDEKVGEGRAVTLSAALIDFSDSVRSEDIPWALQNFHLFDATDDLIASGASRVMQLNRLFQYFLERRLLHSDAIADQPPTDPVVWKCEAAVATALLLVAFRGWIDAGVGRGRFHDHLARTLLKGP